MRRLAPDGLEAWKQAVERGRRLRTELAAVLVKVDAPELRLVHRWLDSWSGIGLIATGMSHQAFTVSLGDHGVGRWIAAFFH